MTETKQTPSQSASANQPRPFPDIISIGDFMATPLEPPPDLVPGVVHKGAKFALGGGSKTYKSWTFASLAAALNSGTDWLNWKCGKARVLYVNFEIPHYFFQYRLKTIQIAQRFEFDKGNLLIWNLRGYPGSFAKIIPELIRRAKGEGIDLIIIDPIYKLYGDTDENSASSVATLLNSFEELTQETAAAVAFGAHYSKGNQAGKEAIDRISGSGVFGRDPDSILNFTPHRDKNCFTVEGVFRNHPPINPFVVQWEFPVFFVAQGLDPANLRLAGGRPPKFSLKDLLELLIDYGRSLPDKDFRELAKTELNMPKTTFGRYVKDLRKQPGVVHTPGGDWCYRNGEN